MSNKQFNKPNDFSEVGVTFLTKDGCRLCDEALVVIEGVRRRHPFDLKIIKIREGDDWYKSYKDKIPVGLINGSVAFTYRVLPDDFIAQLERGRDNP